MSEKILHLAPPLTHLDFNHLFTRMRENEETLQHGERLLHALSSITHPTLLSLNLGNNNILWKDQTRFDLLLDVLQIQHNLEDLNFFGSYFSAAQTE